MTIRTTIRTCIALASVAAAAMTQARAGGDKIAFPENYARASSTPRVDHADNKQFRELYTSRPRSMPPRRASRCRTAP